MGSLLGSVCVLLVSIFMLCKLARCASFQFVEYHNFHSREFPGYIEPGEPEKRATGGEAMSQSKLLHAIYESLPFVFRDDPHVDELSMQNSMGPRADSKSAVWLKIKKTSTALESDEKLYLARRLLWKVPGDSTVKLSPSIPPPSFLSSLWKVSSGPNAVDKSPVSPPPPFLQLWKVLSGPNAVDESPPSPPPPCIHSIWKVPSGPNAIDESPTSTLQKVPSGPDPKEESPSSSPLKPAVGSSHPSCTIFMENLSKSLAHSVGGGVWSSETITSSGTKMYTPDPNPLRLVPNGPDNPPPPPNEKA